MKLVICPKYLVLLLTGLLTACTGNLYRKTNKIHKKQARELSKVYREVNLLDTAGYINPDRWVGTTNFGIRKPNLVVIHHTAQESCKQTLDTFTRPEKVVSSHYLICEDGTVYQMLNDYFRGHHAGVGQWGTDTDINSSSIGIEIDNNGSEPFSEAQMISLELLLASLKTKYKIPQANFIGHSDLAPSRKVDPSEWFDWKRLAEKGYGRWYDDTTALELPVGFDHVVGLKVLGYDVRDTTAAVSSFKRKYFAAPGDTTWTPGDSKILYSLFLKSLKGY